jgi:hypothetical protein
MITMNNRKAQEHLNRARKYQKAARDTGEAIQAIKIEQKANYWFKRAVAALGK